MALTPSEQNRTPGFVTNSGEFVSQASQLLFANFPIFSLGLSVVHWAVYVRTLPSVHVFTAQWTHVHCPVDDAKCAEQNWEVQGKTLETYGFSIDKVDEYGVKK